MSVAEITRLRILAELTTLKRHITDSINKNSDIYQHNSYNKTVCKFAWQNTWFDRCFAMLFLMVKLLIKNWNSVLNWKYNIIWFCRNNFIKNLQINLKKYGNFRWAMYNIYSFKCIKCLNFVNVFLLLFICKLLLKSIKKRKNSNWIYFVKKNLIICSFCYNTSIFIRHYYQNNYTDIQKFTQLGWQRLNNVIIFIRDNSLVLLLSLF